MRDGLGRGQSLEAGGGAVGGARSVAAGLWAEPRGRRRSL
jgi:hypothetical protein